jgi:hypothetical protein
MFPEARIVCLGPPSYAPPIRPADLSSKAVVIWRKGETQVLPDGAESELARIGGHVAATPERAGDPLAALSLHVGRARLDMDGGRRRFRGGERPWRRGSKMIFGYRHVSVDGQGIIAKPPD